MRLKIVGKVQHVGFRYGVLHYVEENLPQIRGYVKNLSDGSVEILAQGNIEELKTLHRYATKGPPSAQVREVQEEIVETTNRYENSFEII